MKETNFRPVTMSELKYIWATLKAHGVWYNGCTHRYLADRFGKDVRHVMGEGWEIREGLNILP